MSTPRADLVGILVLDKPEGISSMTAVAIVRRRAGRAKTGHAGTLDPLATGVLVLALGKATKSIERLMATDKRYRTEIDLSAFTNTDDREGEPVPVEVAATPSREAIDSALDAFRGAIRQRPPAFSAIKIDGRRAYKAARAGATVEIPERPAITHSIEITRYEWPIVELDVRCGKGFYIRSLARDLGTAIGTGGHCASIRRTAVGPFTLDMARTLEDLPEQIGPGELMPLEEALAFVESDTEGGAEL